MQKIIKFIKEVQAEFKHIVWPNRDTLIQLTIVVISISIIVSLILGGFDYLFTNSLNFLSNLTKPQVTVPETQVPETDVPFEIIVSPEPQNSP